MSLPRDLLGSPSVSPCQRHGYGGDRTRAPWRLSSLPSSSAYRSAAPSSGLSPSTSLHLLALRDRLLALFGEVVAGSIGVAWRRPPGRAGRSITPGGGRFPPPGERTVRPPPAASRRDTLKGPPAVWAASSHRQSTGAEQESPPPSRRIRIPAARRVASRSTTLARGVLVWTAQVAATRSPSCRVRVPPLGGG